MEKLRESSILCILVSKHGSLLVGAITGTNTLQMQYNRFDDLITHKYGIVVKNWPLNQFCNPSAVATWIELELLLNSWESGATRFQQLSKDEMHGWENKHFSSKLTMMSLSPPSTPTPVPPLLTAPLAPPAPDLIPLVPSVAVPPEPAPPTPIQPGCQEIGLVAFMFFFELLFVELEADYRSYGSPAIAHKRAEHSALKPIDRINLRLVHHELYCAT